MPFSFTKNPLDEEDDDETDAGPGEMLKTNPTSEIIKDFKAPSTGTTADLSHEELDNLKKTNPIEYLNTIMSARGSLIDKCSSSSTISGGHPANDPADEILKKIKEKDFYFYLLQFLE